MRIVKTIAAYFIALMVIFQSLSLLYIECEFNLNKTYIAKVLCINRDKPQMHCDGKCFLKKEMNRNADQQSNDQKSINTYSSIVLFVEQPLQQNFFSEKGKPTAWVFQTYFSPGFLTTAERPPTA